MLSGANDQNAEEIHQSHSKVTSAKCYEITDIGRNVSDHKQRDSLNFKEENKRLYRSNSQMNFIVIPEKV